MPEILNNYPLISALLAVVTAQVLKVPIYFISDQKLDLRRLFTTGGMPSSHSAFVLGLITSLILVYGLDHPLVAVAIVFGIITMYDATGIRRQAGKHAMILNVLREEIGFLSKGFSGMMPNKDNPREKLKEMLGHEPLEVGAGAALGSLVSFLLFRFYF